MARFHAHLLHGLRQLFVQVLDHRGFRQRAAVVDMKKLETPSRRAQQQLGRR